MLYCAVFVVTTTDELIAVDETLVVIAERRLTLSHSTQWLQQQYTLPALGGIAAVLLQSGSSVSK